MRRRKFLAMLAALPIVGRFAPKTVIKEHAAAIRQTKTYWIESKGYRIPTIAYRYPFKEPNIGDFGADMYTYPTKRLDLQIVDATTPGDVPDTSRQEPEPDHR